MVRDDLYITVPSFFRCPISLDVMKSPVSLCTGVTYDRSSIQHWLDSGNNTCPATMQVLQSKEFVPNRTLQRLIQIWSDSVRHRVDSVSSQDQVISFVKNLETGMESTDDECFLSLSNIVSFAKESEENCDYLARMEGFLSVLVDLMGNADAEIKFMEQAVRILDLISAKISDRKRLSELMLKSGRDCLSTILVVMRRGSLDSQIGSVRVLESIAIDAEAKLLIAEKEGLLLQVVKSISKEKDPKLMEAGLSCLVEISMPKRVKGRLIQLETIKELRNLLTEASQSVSTTEKALKVLEALSSCKEGRAEICQDAVLIEAIMQKLLKVSNSATEHAVTILWSTCYLFRDQGAQEAVTGGNGLTKFLLLIQSNCSPAIRQMAADLLRIFRVNSKSCLSSYDTKTTHIMPF